MYERFHPNGGMMLENAREEFAPYCFQTRNINEGENKAHTREGAQELGFRGSIVGGAIVYGQMIRPLIERFGGTWLKNHWFDLRFRAPAFDEDWVTSTVTPDMESPEPYAFCVRSENAEGQELITMQAHIPVASPAANRLASRCPVEWEGERELGTWERMKLDIPFRAFQWKLSLSQHRAYCEKTGERLPIFLNGDNPPVHPGLVMAQGSFAVQNQFVMPFWIHTGSTILTRQMIRVGDNIELRCIPIEKWKRGENEWVRFYQVYLLDGKPAVEAWKSSIIKYVAKN